MDDVTSDTAEVEPPVEETQLESSELGEQLDAARAKADEHYNQFLLARADFENYRKRSERRIAEVSEHARRSVLLKFLPVLDNLERALAFEDGNDGLRDGLQQTLRGFEALLSGEGVKPIATKGEKFDPRVAEAIGTQSQDGVADDTVIEETQRGYAIGDEVLRPAKVIVAKAK